MANKRVTRYVVMRRHEYDVPAPVGVFSSWTLAARRANELTVATESRYYVEKIRFRTPEAK